MIKTIGSPALLCLLVGMMMSPVLAAESRAGAGHGHHAFPADVAQFHSVMAPLWHAAAGAERTARACDQVGQLREGAARIQAAPAPQAASDASQWTEAAARLADQVQALDAACGTPERAGVAQSLAGLHHAFHALVRYVGHHH